MIVFVSNNLLEATLVIDENIYAPSDDGVTDIPDELRIALGVIPMVNVEPTITTEELPAVVKKG